MIDANQDTTQNMNDDTTTLENSIETIYAQDSAHVEDFRIRPITVEADCLEMHVKMRIGGGEAVYYLDATVTYSDDDDAGHHVRIRRRGAGVVDEFTTDVVTASPEDSTDAVQALHEVYIQAVDDWYEYARAAEKAGETA